MTGAGGSQQLRRYRIARRDGATVATACVLAGIGMGEARLIEAEDLKNPPPPEAFILLTTAPAEALQPKEDDMASRKPKDTPISGEVPKPDFGLAVRIYREDIKPAQARVGEFAQEQSTAFKAIKKRAHIQPQAAKAAFKLDDMEPSKRDDWLRSFNGLLKALGIFMPVDLADIAEGKGEAGQSVVPTGDRPRPQLATVPKSDPPADDSDLAGVEPQAAE